MRCYYVDQFILRTQLKYNCVLNNEEVHQYFYKKNTSRRRYTTTIYKKYIRLFFHLKEKFVQLSKFLF